MMKTKRKRNLPAKPDWYFVDARVEDFWAAVDFEPPLNLLDIFRAGGCTVKTYQELSQKLDISVDEVAARFGSDDGCLFYDARHDRYRLAYDCSTRPRTRWTLAHELGHRSQTPRGLPGDQHHKDAVAHAPGHPRQRGRQIRR